MILNAQSQVVAIGLWRMIFGKSEMIQSLERPYHINHGAERGSCNCFGWHGCPYCTDLSWPRIGFRALLVGSWIGSWLPGLPWWFSDSYSKCKFHEVEFLDPHENSRWIRQLCRGATANHVTMKDFKNKQMAKVSHSLICAMPCRWGQWVFASTLGQKTKVRVKDSHESKPDRGRVRIRGLKDVSQVCQTLPSVEKVTTLNAVVDGGIGSDNESNRRRKKEVLNAKSFQIIGWSVYCN